MYTPHAKGGVQTSIKAGNRYRVLTTFPGALALVEEYDAVTLNLECRRWKSTRQLGGSTEWEHEIGDPTPENPQGRKALLNSSSLNPSFHPRDTRKSWEWHIRNLPYPERTYNISVDDEKQALVLRTANKKYFKVFKVPALVRAGIALQASSIKISHDDGGSGTLVISYAKPDSIRDEERKARASAKKASYHASNGVNGVKGVKGVNGAGATAAVERARGGVAAGGGNNEGPPECSQS